MAVFVHLEDVLVKDVPVPGQIAPEFFEQGARTKLYFMAHSEDEIHHFIFFEPEVVAYA